MNICLINKRGGIIDIDNFDGFSVMFLGINDVFNLII